ncbi:MAG: hypothetical protein O3B68_17255 [Planctomycetota bacterium]|nr:hypothetical protein [Planctomycetota bacterium]
MHPNLVPYRTRIGSVFVLLAVAAAGCGGGGDGLERVAVSGSVTIDGEPVANGVVRFRPAQGTEGPMASTMITGGRYDIPGDQGPVAGEYEVQVQAYEDPSAASAPTTPATPARPAVASDKLGPKTSSDDSGNETAPGVPQAPKESKRTFNVTIPELSSFEQDFAL